MILSVSRRTDIPNHYSDWFFQRLEEGYVCVRNPINAHQVSRICLSPEVLDMIVFWTKNPAPMLERLDELEAYKYYFQFTLNGYGPDIEPGMPDADTVRVPVFRKLSEKIGKKRAVWRYDPILFTDTYTEAWHMETFEHLAGQLCGYTDTVVISFVDMYQKIQKAVRRLAFLRPEEAVISRLAAFISRTAGHYDMKVQTCGEDLSLEQYGIHAGACIDKTRIESITDYQIRGKRDRYQRKTCGCIESVEIGTYHTCPNHCVYCYANDLKRYPLVSAKYDRTSPILCGELREDDCVTEKKMESQRRKRRRRE